MSIEMSATEPARRPGVPDPIVVGVDLAGRSTSAVVWAAEEAERSGRPLRLVSVRDAAPEQEAESLHHGLAGLARRLVVSDVEHRVCVGSPVDRLLEAAEHASLLVLGRRSMSPVHRLVASSTSLAVAGRSPVPVIVVPEPWLQPSLSSAPLVLGLEPDDITSAGAGAPAPAADRDGLLDFAFARAARLRVPLIVVSAWDVPAPYARSPLDIASCQPRYQAALEARLAPWREAHPEVEAVAKTAADAPVHALLHAGQVAQLTVLGRRADGHHLPGSALGPTARRVLQGARRPVAVVPLHHNKQPIRRHHEPRR